MRCVTRGNPKKCNITKFKNLLLYWGTWKSLRENRISGTAFPVEVEQPFREGLSPVLSPSCGGRSVWAEPATPWPGRCTELPWSTDTSCSAALSPQRAGAGHDKLQLQNPYNLPSSAPVKLHQRIIQGPGRGVCTSWTNRLSQPRVEVRCVKCQNQE